MGVKVRQKKKGKGEPWWVFVCHNGRRTSRKVGDKRSAESVASTIRAKLQLGEFGFDEPEEKAIPLFKDFAEGFMETYSAMNHKPSTQASYRMALDVHLNPVFGDMPLDMITRKDIKRFIADKQKEEREVKRGKKEVEKKRYSAASVRNLKAYLSCILNEAVDDELIPANPAARTGKLIKKPDRVNDVNPLTWEEKAKLEKVMLKHFPRHYALFLLLLRTGMRIGEAIALRPGDLDFNSNFIEVRRSFVRGRLSSPKSGKIRRIDMTAQLGKVLKDHLTERKREALRRGWGVPPEWLFYNETGNILDINHMRNRVLHRCLEKAKLRRIRVHDLRHTYATLRISKGDNIADVSKQLGHHSINITVDTYYHWMPGGNKSEVDELDGNAAPKCTPYAPTEAKEGQGAGLGICNRQEY
jgi:integrase